MENSGLQTFDFNYLDYSVLISYFVTILLIGFVFTRKKKKGGTNDFILGGRFLTLPIFVATLVATWYGNILGIGEFAYNDGIVAWMCFCFPYYIAAGFFAVFIAKKIRQSQSQTIPEQIEKKFGKKPAWLASLIVLIITIPASYSLMLGNLLQMFTGWDLWLCIVIGAAISISYLFTGGFRADVYTNVAQFIIMYLGFFILIVFAYLNFGSPFDMLAQLPAQHLEPAGKYSIQYILVWFIIAFQTFVDPSFHQRCAAATSPRTAQRGVWLSILFWMVFDTMTITSGLYAKAFIETSNSVLAFPLLGEAVLPHFWKGFFVVTLLAVVMSTLDSYSFISSITIGNDILRPILQKKGKLKISTERLTQIGLLITSLIAVLIAVLLPSAIEIIYKTASIAVPGLLFPLIISYSKKYTLSGKSSIFVMAVSSFVSAFWTAGNYLAQSNSFTFSEYFLEIEAMLPGIFVSLILCLILIKKKNE